VYRNFHRSRPQCIQVRASLGIDVDFDGCIATAARRAGCKTQDVSTIPRIMSGNAATTAVSPKIAVQYRSTAKDEEQPCIRPLLQSRQAGHKHRRDGEQLPYANDRGEIHRIAQVREACYYVRHSGEVCGTNRRQRE
jgi:hypothetical protein